MVHVIRVDIQRVAERQWHISTAELTGREISYGILGVAIQSMDFMSLVMDNTGISGISYSMHLLFVFSNDSSQVCQINA
ncbi:hypothetical protein Mapa_008031 [Marchantia paleacea]|nr:hypothetical protein Mapa_008031 [Marchantia paleacea]